MSLSTIPSFSCLSASRISIAALVAASVLLVGCGGGGGVSAGLTPQPVPTTTAPEPTFTDSRTTLPSALSRSFVPNYTPAVDSKGIWNGRTLRVYFDSESEVVVSAALHRWEDATGGFFHWERVTSASDAQITFLLVPASEFTPGMVGRTGYTYNAVQSRLISSEVRYARVGTEADQVRIVVHEIGHAVGIHGHSDTNPDMMCPTVTPQTVITERDLNTLFWLYRDTIDSPVSPSRSATQEATGTIFCEAEN